MVWNNADGLQVMYGTEQGRANRVGTVKTFGPRNSVKVVIDVVNSNLVSGTTGARVALVDNLVIPQGALITSARLTVLTAFTSSGSGTLDIGLAKLDGTELDFDGIDAAIATSALNAVGKTVACDGALINGVALTAPGVAYIKAGTAAFQLGKAEVIIEYKPSTSV